MFKGKYYSMNEQISPNQELVNKIIHFIDEPKRETNKAKLFFSSPITIVVMLMVLVLTATPVLAANVTAIYKLMYFISRICTEF